MPRKRSSGWKNNTPRLLSDPSVEFTIDEITQSSKSQADRDGHGNYISHGPQIKPVLPDDIQSRQDATEQPAVKRHPSLPDGKDLERMRQVPAQVVKEDVSATSPQNNAKRH